MRLRGIRLLVHRGQVLLILVVGLLAGVAVAGVCIQLAGFPVMGSLHLDQLLAPPRTQMPSQIVIGANRPAPVPSNDSATAGSAQTRAAPAPQPTPTTAVVPPDVYTYPPDGHGRGGPGPGSGGDGRGSRSGG